jgi:pimeloyl-ACP methyl ester carboxylesterase
MTSTAILVHGVPTTAKLWDGVIARLDGSRRVIALDLPGFAEPPPPGWRGVKEEYVEWLTGQIEAVTATDGPVHLVGHDWGLPARVPCGLIAPGAAAQSHLWQRPH